MLVLLAGSKWGRGDSPASHYAMTEAAD
jgi:hypothetical protein